MLPKEFTDRMRQMLGEEYPAFLESYDRTRAQALRVNPDKCKADLFQKNSPFELDPVEWEPNGFYYGPGDAPGKHPYHAAGVYYIQEPSAMAPAAYLGTRPGERILDLCAAPGGKSTQILAALQGSGFLVSNEIHPARARILSENIERMGFGNCIVTNESPAVLASRFLAYFDRIMVDAPCSGEGMFRKNDEAAFEWSPENVRLCADRQKEILSSAAAMLRPGGRIVYSTCTFSVEENEGVIDSFISDNPDFTLIDAKKYDGMSPGYGDCAKAIRLFPHRLRGEGHFLAVLQRDGIRSEIKDIGGAISSGREKEYEAFAKEFLRFELPPDRALTRFGEQLYLLPKGAPELKKLKVLRPGLHLGTIKKNRFEPAHALALSLKPQEAGLRFDLRADDPRILAYLTGQTFPAEGEKGWYLITVDGYGLGWGKLAGGIMKNHYPRGLRIQR